MKIIRPLNLASGQIASNAPADQYPEWAPVGRENLSDVPAPVLAADGNTLYYITGNDSLSESHDIGVQDLASGEVLTAFGTVFGIGKVMAVSPNGAWLALVREEGSGYYVNVFDLQTGQLVYADQAYASNNRPLITWSSASDQLAYTYSASGENNKQLCARVVSSSSWASPAQTQTIGDLAGHSFPVAETIDGMDWDSGSSLFITGVSTQDFFSGPYSCRLAKFSTAGATLGNIEISSQPYNYKMGVNRSRDDVVVLGTNIQFLYDAADLSGLSTPSSLQFKAIDFRAAGDGSEFYLRSAGTSPPNRRFNSADYSELAAFPVNGEYGMIYATGYALFPYYPGGYDIVDRATNQELGLINPQVSEGDTYIYSERVYGALTDNQDRPDMGALLDPPTWVNLGAINPLRLIDGQVGTFTEAAGPLEIVFSNVNVVDGIALFNLLAQSVLVELVDETEGVVFSTGEISLVDNTGVTDWYQYFYSPITNRQDFVFTGLPPYRGADVRVVLTDVSGALQVGEIALGPIRNLGDTEFGTSVGILDFSRKDRDTFGNFIITERRFSKRANYDISLRTNQIAFAQQLLAKLRATPAVFIGAESQPETIIYGFYRSFDIVLSGVVYSDCTIEVEGLT